MGKVKRSPWLLHYDASSCNGCDIEVLACMTPVYDVERFGVVNTADPMQADILLVTGGVNSQSAEVVKQLYDQMARPKFQALSAVLHIKETEHADRDKAPKALKVVFK